MKRSKNAGFTLVELLVVITILGMLMALVFPAIAGVMETVRKTTCKNNLRGMAQATTMYITANGCYPGLVEPRGFSKSTRGGNRCTWATLLLQQMDEGPTVKTWTDARSNSGQAFMEIKQVKSYLCPNDTQDSYSKQALSYVANAGYSKDVNVSLTSKGRSAINFANGVFFNRYTGGRIPGAMFTDAHIEDGGRQTALFAENLQAWQWGDKRTGAGTPLAYDQGTTKAVETAICTGFVWDSLDFNAGIDGETEDFKEIEFGDDIKWARPSSNHPEGAMMAFCDGSAKMVSDTIAQWVYRRLVVSDYKKSDLPLNDFARTSSGLPEF